MPSRRDADEAGHDDGPYSPYMSELGYQEWKEQNVKNHTATENTDLLNIHMLYKTLVLFINFLQGIYLKSDFETF